MDKQKQLYVVAAVVTAFAVLVTALALAMAAQLPPWTVPEPVSRIERNEWGERVDRHKPTHCAPLSGPEWRKCMGVELK